MGSNDAPLLLDVSRLVWRRWAGTRPTGIDRICLAWLDRYAPYAQAVIIRRHVKVILPRHVSRALFRALQRPDDIRQDTWRFRRELLSLVLRWGVGLPGRFEGYGRLWLNPGHTGLDAAGIAAWVHKSNIRPLYFVHDLIPITHPEYCRDGEGERHRRRMLTVLETGAGVVANSAHTLDTLTAFARDEGAALPPATAIWPGTPRFPAIRPDKADRARFIVLGTIEGRKNHRLLLSVWKDFLARAQGRDLPELVIVGRRGWQADDVFAMLDGTDFRGSVREVGPVNDEGLTRLFAGARALLFPSLAEGYGIPLVEALAAGVPVIASDLPVFREIGQGVPDLLPVCDPKAWHDAILDYADPASARRTAQLQRIAAFRTSEWSDHFARLDDFLREIQPNLHRG